MPLVVLKLNGELWGIYPFADKEDARQAADDLMERVPEAVTYTTEGELWEGLDNEVAAIREYLDADVEEGN